MRPRARLLAALAVAVLGSGTLACSTGGTGTPDPPPPLDLAGARIMLVPARPGEPPELDREILAWLNDLAPAADLIPPERVRSTVESNPGSGFDLAAPRLLQNVGGGRMRVVDPLYGDLRRLGAILDAPMALVPMATQTRTDSLGVSVDLTAVLVTVRAGRVVWIHTATGGPTDAAGTSASAAVETLVRTLTGR